jgi:hypothetical protein
MRTLRDPTGPDSCANTSPDGAPPRPRRIAASSRGRPTPVGTATSTAVAFSIRTDEEAPRRVTLRRSGSDGAASPGRRSATAPSTSPPGENPCQTIALERSPGSASEPGARRTSRTGAGTVST